MLRSRWIDLELERQLHDRSVIVVAEIDASLI